MCCTPSTAQQAELDELFALLNEYRAQKSKAPLTYDAGLAAAAQGHCEHMRTHGFFDHYAPESAVKTPSDRAARCGGVALAENLAGGQRTPAAVMADWKASAGHNTNMLGNYKRVGLCRAGQYWGQVFGN